MAMNLGPQHLKIAAGLVVLSLIYNAWVFFGKSNAMADVPMLKNADQPLLGAQASAGQPGVAGLAPQPATDPMTIPAPTPIDLAKEPIYTRDPLLYGTENRDPLAAPVVEAPPEQEQPVNVTAILYSPERRIALVDGQPVKIGDSLGEGVVSDIQPNAVIIRTLSGRTRRIEVNSAVPGAARVKKMEPSK